MSSPAVSHCLLYPIRNQTAVIQNSTIYNHNIYNTYIDLTQGSSWSYSPKLQGEICLTNIDKRLDFVTFNDLTNDSKGLWLDFFFFFFSIKYSLTLLVLEELISVLWTRLMDLISAREVKHRWVSLVSATARTWHLDAHHCNLTQSDVRLDLKAQIVS